MENEQLAVLSTFGPILVGAFLNAILYGALLIQTYFYCQSNTRDSRSIKFLVFFLLVTESVSLILDFGVVWEPLILNYGSSEVFQKTPTTFSADPLVTALISTAVQIFQGWRIRKLIKSNILFILIVTIACATLAAGFVTTVLIALHPSFNQLQMFEFSFLSWLVASAIGDVVIAASLSWFVLRHKTSSTPTNSILNKIMFFHTGTITAVAAIADVFTFTLSDEKTLEFIWAYSLSKLYSNSLLSMLNARVEWNKLLDPPIDEGDGSFLGVEDLPELKAESTVIVRNFTTNTKMEARAIVVHPPF